MKTLVFQVSDDLFIRLRDAIHKLQEGNTSNYSQRAVVCGLLEDGLKHRSTKQLRTLAEGHSLPLGRPAIAETDGIPSGPMTPQEERDVGAYLARTGQRSIGTLEWRKLVAEGKDKVVPASKRRAK